MKITELLDERLNNLDLRARSKWGVIQELSEMLLNGKRICSLNKFILAVRAREKQVTTGIGSGIAIPHAISNSVITPSIAFGRSRSGIDYQSVDNVPVKLVFLFAIPDTCDDKDYLRALANLARMLVHAKTIENLLTAVSPKKVIDAFQQDK
jgi:fructose-specific phosphotransferase system IIA component